MEKRCRMTPNMRPLRRLLFYIFSAAYLILCPVILLYAFGYLFSPKEQTLVRTGLVYIATTPPKAAVFLEKSRYARKTPAILNGLLPGDATLSLMLKNYRPWVHRISIEPGKALTFDKILLIPQRWPQQEIFPDPIKEITPLPDTNYLVIAKDRRLSDIFVIDLADARSWPLVATGTPLAQASFSSFATAAKDPRLLLRAILDGTEVILWAEIKKGKPSVLRDITRLFPEKPSVIAWEQDEKNILLDIHPDHVNAIDLAARTSTAGYLLAIRGFGLFNKKITFLRTDNTLERQTIGDHASRILSADAALGETLFGREGFFKITPLSDDIIVFLGERGELLTNRLPYRFVEKGVVGFQFDARTERLLVYQKDRIGILDFSARPLDNTFEAGPRLTWTTAQGKNIRQCWWAHDASHILFLDDDEVFLLEQEPCGPPHIDYVTRVARDKTVHYDEESGQLFFLDPETEKLNALEIVPRRERTLAPRTQP